MQLAAMLYAHNDFPPRADWSFFLPSGHEAAPELRERGLIVIAGPPDEKGAHWKLSHAGYRWALANRREAADLCPALYAANDSDISTAALSFLRGLVAEYVSEGAPPLHDLAWRPVSDDETVLFNELATAGFVERHNTQGRWILTAQGRAAGRPIRSPGGGASP